VDIRALDDPVEAGKQLSDPTSGSYVGLYQHLDRSFVLFAARAPPARHCCVLRIKRFIALRKKDGTAWSRLDRHPWLISGERSRNSSEFARNPMGRYLDADNLLARS
jgi:hypothetical protein